MIAIFLAGFILGLYITLLDQNQLRILGKAGTYIAIIPLFTGGVGAMKIFFEWRKELGLKFKGTIPRDVHYAKHGDLVTKLYCLRVKKTGVGGAENCEGQIKIDDLGQDYFKTEWYNDDNPTPLITMDEKYLKLFEVIEMDNKKKIRFYRVGRVPIESEYNDENINRKISAKIGSKNARVPRSSYSKKISEIINSHNPKH